jgi:hypothetical protein
VEGAAASTLERSALPPSAEWMTDFLAEVRAVNSVVYVCNTIVLCM